MAQKELSAFDVKNFFAQARKSELNCAILSGKSSLIVSADRRKPVAAMRKEAKAAGGSAKGVWGSVRLEGKTLRIASEVEAPGAFDKIIKKHFSGLGYSIQVQIEMVDPKAVSLKEASSEEDRSSKLESRQEKVNAKRKTAVAEVELRTDNAFGHEKELAVSNGEYPEDPEIPDSTYELAADTVGLKEIIAAARNTPMNFAWLTGKQGLVLKADRRKTYPVLVKLAKSEGASARGAWGTMTVAGRDIVLRCVNVPPKSMPKKAKTYLREQGEKYKVTLFLPDGENIPDLEADLDEHRDCQIFCALAL